MLKSNFLHILFEEEIIEVKIINFEPFLTYFGQNVIKFNLVTILLPLGLEKIWDQASNNISIFLSGLTSFE